LVLPSLDEEQVLDLVLNAVHGLLDGVSIISLGCNPKDPNGETHRQYRDQVPGVGKVG
jgi:hypothetical protein